MPELAVPGRLEVAALADQRLEAAGRVAAGALADQGLEESLAAGWLLGRGCHHLRWRAGVHGATQGRC